MHSPNTVSEPVRSLPSQPYPHQHRQHSIDQQLINVARNALQPCVSPQLQGSITFSPLLQQALSWEAEMHGHFHNEYGTFFKRELERVQHGHKNVVDGMIRENQRMLERVDQDHSKMIDDLNDEKQRALEQLKKQHTTVVQQLKNENKKLEKSADEHATTSRGFAADVETLNKTIIELQEAAKRRIISIYMRPTNPSHEFAWLKVEMEEWLQRELEEERWCCAWVAFGLRGARLEGERYRSRIGKLRSQLEHTRKECKTLTQSSTELEDRISDLEQQLLDDQEATAIAKRELDHSKRTCTAAEKAGAELQKRLHDSISAHNRAENVNVKLKAALAEFEAGKRADLDEIKDLRIKTNQIPKLQKEYQMCKDVRDGTVAQNQALQRELNIQKRKYNEELESVNNLNKEVKKLEAQKSKAEQELKLVRERTKETAMSLLQENKRGGIVRSQSVRPALGYIGKREEDETSETKPSASHGTVLSGSSEESMALHPQREGQITRAVQDDLQHAAETPCNQRSLPFGPQENAAENHCLTDQPPWIRIPLPGPAQSSMSPPTAPASMRGEYDRSRDPRLFHESDHDGGSPRKRKRSQRAGSARKRRYSGSHSGYCSSDGWCR